MNKNLTFLFGCLGTRLMLAYAVKNLSAKHLYYTSFPAALVGIAFLSIYLFDLRKTGKEAGGLIWWNKMRPIHAMMFLLFASYAFKKESFSWVILLLDPIIGFIAWLYHYR